MTSPCNVSKADYLQIDLYIFYLPTSRNAKLEPIIKLDAGSESENASNVRIYIKLKLKKN